MNNKIHDGEDGLEAGEGEKIYPVAMFRQQQKERQRMMIVLIYIAAVVQFVLGVLVMALNIIFIYDGMNSKWYGSRDMEANEEGVMFEITSGLQVPSIGEGILAGGLNQISTFLTLDLFFQRIFLHVFGWCSNDCNIKERKQEGFAGGPCVYPTS